MIDYATFSAIGDKNKNEDAVRVFVNQPLSAYGFALADGLGGHGNGDVASTFVVDCVGAVIENTDQIRDELIAQCFEIAQEMLLDEKETTGLMSIQTTLVLLLMTGSRVWWGHVGDSRLYHFRKGKLLSRTLDHSVPQMLALQGQIKEKEIRRHAQRNMLLRALGTEWEDDFYEIDAVNLEMQKGDSFLLCSDGFWDWIDEKTMSRILKQDGSAFDLLQEMRTIVEAAGAGQDMDNFSAILVCNR